MVDVAIVHQPELRALMLFDKVPEGCVLFPCTDASAMPHIRPGEFVIVDTTDRCPCHGELYVIKFGERDDQSRICMARKQTGIQWSRKDLPQDGWTVGAVRNDEMQSLRVKLQSSSDLPRNQFISMLLQAQRKIGAWSEGPYATEGSSYEHLCNCLVGSVIGIYQPSFDEPRRPA